MPFNSPTKRRKMIQRYATPEPTEERSFACLEDERTHALVCAIIEQAVYDWIGLDYGKLGCCLARPGRNAMIYRAEVESFFKGKWFEYLLSYALPNYTPETIRKQLRIAEPERGAK